MELTSDAHLWAVQPDQVVDPASLSEYENWLSSAEREAYESFRFAADGKLYLVAHALLRSALSRYAGIHPSAWSFRHNRYGRPEILSPVTVPPLRFNISHTDGLAVCLVTQSMDCGVDVEKIREVGDEALIARDILSPAELDDLRACDGARRRERFFEYWVLKEAYSKAVGAGLSLPLTGISFHIASHAQPASLEPRLDEPTAKWRFYLSRPTPSHVLAVALDAARRAGAAPALDYLHLNRIEPVAMNARLMADSAIRFDAMSMIPAPYSMTARAASTK